MERTVCQMIDCSLNRNRRPMSIAELIAELDLQPEDLLPTLNRMLGSGWLHVVDGKRVARVLSEAEGF